MLRGMPVLSFNNRKKGVEMAFYEMTLPLSEEQVRSLRIGDQVELTGVLYTARDAAHRRLVELLDRNESLPLPLQDQCLYFVGPCPAPPGRAIGSAGPTTSGRMDAYSPRLIRECGLRAMIGKGERSKEVAEAMETCGAVYFAATGGAGALLASRILKCEVIAFPDLGPEAICKLTVERFPVVVAMDSHMGNLYER